MTGTFQTRPERDKVLTGPTNKAFAASDTIFIKACALAEIPASKRQASKWRRGTGRARRFHAAAVSQINAGGLDA